MIKRPEYHIDSMIAEKTFRSQVLSSIIWVAGLNYLGQIIRWVATIFVIRLLSPADFGLMAKAAVFISFLTMISELGLESAIIQKKNVSKSDLTHVFAVIIIFNILLGSAFFLITPLIANFYRDTRLIPILRVMSSIFLFLPLYILQRGLLMREMNFRSKSIVDLAGSLVAAGATLILALRGFGVWALVWGNIASHLVMAAGYNIARKGLIIPRFALRGYSEFLTFGGFLTGSRILLYFYSMSDIFVGGRYLSNKLLGVYSVAMQLATIPIEKIMPIISQVAFPAYSRIQSETERVRSHFIKSVRLLSFIIFPVYGGLFLIAPQMVNLFLGHKWGEIILPISLLCLIMPFRSLSTLFPPLLNGLGRPDVDFVNVTMASLILPPAFLIGVRKGILGICFAWIIGYSFVFAIASIRSLRVLGIKYNAYISSIIMPIISTLAMIIAVRLFALVAGHYLSSILQLILYVLLGMLFYLAAMFMTRRSAIIEVLSIIRKR